MGQGVLAVYVEIRACPALAVYVEIADIPATQGPRDHGESEEEEDIKEMTETRARGEYEEAPAPRVTQERPARRDPPALREERGTQGQ